MSKISLIFYWVFFAVLNLKASEYEITVLATNTANFGGIGEWSFSALLESDDEKILLEAELEKSEEEFYYLNFNEYILISKSFNYFFNHILSISCVFH